MDKLKVSDLKQHILKYNKDTFEIETDNDFSSYIFNYRDKYWIVSKIFKFDSIFEQNSLVTNLLEVLKFVFGTAVEYDDFVAVDKEGYLVVQRLLKQDNPTNIDESLIENAVSEHNDYSEYLLHLLDKNKNDTKEVGGSKLKVFMP